MTGPSSRMLELLSLLQVRRDWPGDVLANRLHVSARTIRRDVDRLRDLGYRIQALHGPTGGYRLGAGSELPPLLFDDEQAVAVALALAVAPASGADIADAATRALATVRQVMPSRLRSRVDTVQIAPTLAATMVSPDVLVTVSEATRAHEILRFDYDPAWGSATDSPAHQVEPHAVVARGGRWYLLAWEDKAADWRTYRIDRIHPRLPTRKPFHPKAIPGSDPVAFVAGRFRGSEEVSTTWPCVGTAEVDLPAHRIAPYIDADAALEDIDGPTSRLTIGSWSWAALVARFASLDATFRIIGPAQLVDAATEIAHRLTAASASGGVVQVKLRR